MKKKTLYTTLLTGLLTAGIFTGFSVSTKAAQENTSTGDTAQFQTLLEDSGFTVQQGSFQELDTIKAASEGKLMSCFGNNAGSSYMVFNLPDAPNQEVPNPAFPPG